MAKTDLSPSIARAARRLRFVTQGAAALVLVGSVLAASQAAGAGFHRTASVNIDAGGLTGVPAAMVLLVPAGLLAAALLQLVAMLRVVEKGAPFGAAGQLRGFALRLFMAVLAGVLLPPALHIGLGTGPAILTISSGDALMLLVTALLFFVARLLLEAQRVADEHRQFV